MTNYPDGVTENSKDAPWNNYPTDTELEKQSKLAQTGLEHANALADILDQLNLYFEIYPLIKRLEEMV